MCLSRSHNLWHCNNLNYTKMFGKLSMFIKKYLRKHIHVFDTSSRLFWDKFVHLFLSFSCYQQCCAHARSVNGLCCLVCIIGMLVWLELIVWWACVLFLSRMLCGVSESLKVVFGLLCMVYYVHMHSILDVPYISGISHIVWFIVYICVSDIESGIFNLWFCNCLIKIVFPFLFKVYQLFASTLNMHYCCL